MDLSLRQIASILLGSIAALTPLASSQAAAPLVVGQYAQAASVYIEGSELYVVDRRTNVPGDLLRRLQRALPDAAVREESPDRAWVKFRVPINEVDAAAGRDPVSVAVPGVEVLPVLYPQGVPNDPRAASFLTRDVLVSVPQDSTPQALAARIGAVAHRPTIKEGFHILTLPTPYQTFDAVRTLRALDLFAEPLIQWRAAKYAVALPKDQFFNTQWHLLNTGQDNGVPGIDANVLGAWQVTKGASVTLSIVDDCLQTLHPDLAAACPPIASGLHYDFNGRDADPRPEVGDAHGTACAGVAAARQNNGNPDLQTGALLGVTGAAPETRLLGLRLISGAFTDEDTANAIFWRPGGVPVVDVSSNSWGPPDGYFGLAGPGILAREALRRAAVEGRDSRGQVTVFAGGNGLSFGDDSNYDGYAASRYVLAVGALGHRGQQAVYSEPGANLLIASPSQGSFTSIAITTTDVTGTNGYNPESNNPSNFPNLSNTDYTNTFNGTSSAAPLVSGCVSLMLAANPLLGWRDVKEIVAATATLVDSSDLDWDVTGFGNGVVPNGAGFNFNHKYGAGMINAAAAVARAQTWTPLGTEVSQSRSLTSGAGGAVPAAIPANGTALVRTFDFSAEPNLRVEQIEVVVAATHASRGDLEVAIISPSGTRSILASPHFAGGINPNRDLADYVVDFTANRLVQRPGGWTFTTTHNWGENSTGIWRLEIRDFLNPSLNGTLTAATVNLYGTRASNSVSDQSRFVFEQARYSVSERDGQAVLRVRRLGPTNDAASVSFTTLPTNDVARVFPSTASRDDFQPQAGTLNFSAGAVFADAEIRIPLTDDSEGERPEYFFVVLTNPVNGSLGGANLATVDLFDDETNEVTVIATRPNARETDEGITDEEGVFTISRAIPSATPLTVKFSLAGTAKLGTAVDSDYTIDTLPVGAQYVTIPALQTSATVRVRVTNDRAMEEPESVVLTVSPDATYSTTQGASATVTIFDNDLPQIQLTALDDLAKEKAADQDYGVLRIQRVGANGIPLPVDQPLTVFLGFRGTQIPPGTAFENYQLETPAGLITNAVVIPRNESHVDITLKPVDDLRYQPTKTAIVDLQVNPTYTFSFGFLSSAQVTILEDEAPPEAVDPVIAIRTPDAKPVIAPTTVQAGGTASDNERVNQVLYRVNRAGGWFPANFVPGTSVTWTADLTVASTPGMNTLEVKAIDTAGNESAIQTRQYNRVVPQELTLNIAGSGKVTKADAGVSSIPVGTRVTYTAAANPGSVFRGWSGFITSREPVISFTMPNAPVVLNAEFITSPFVPAIAGNYSGIVRAATFARETSGFIRLTVTPMGGFTGTAIMNGVSYNLRGAFAGDGIYEGTLRGRNSSAFPIRLVLDLNVPGTGKMTGFIRTGAVDSIVDADRAGFDRNTPAPSGIVRSYTFAIPAPAVAAVPDRDPRGHGFGTATIDAQGNVKLMGTLGDGSKFSQTQALTRNQTWPLFASLYRGAGVVLGNITVDPNQASTDFGGTVNWAKGVVPRDPVLPIGFSVTGLQVVGSIYTPLTTVPPGFVTTVDGTRVALLAGNLPQAGLVRTATFTPEAFTITNPGASALGLKVKLATGTFSGTFVHPATLRPVKFDGVFVPKQRLGFGSFVGALPQRTAPTRPGSVTITPIVPAGP